MLPTLAGFELPTSWSPVGHASNWATEASICTMSLGDKDITLLVQTIPDQAQSERASQIFHKKGERNVWIQMSINYKRVK